MQFSHLKHNLLSSVLSGFTIGFSTLPHLVYYAIVSAAKLSITSKLFLRIWALMYPQFSLYFANINWFNFHLCFIYKKREVFFWILFLLKRNIFLSDFILDYRLHLGFQSSRNLQVLVSKIISSYGKIGHQKAKLFYLVQRLNIKNAETISKLCHQQIHPAFNNELNRHDQ